MLKPINHVGIVGIVGVVIGIGVKKSPQFFAKKLILLRHQ
jgi:hypothetical protein